MMAFFMLMWLLNATTEKQRKGLADYFSPTIPVNRVSGGGDGAFGGDSVFTQDERPQHGTGATNLRPAAENKNGGEDGQTDGHSAEQMKAQLSEITKTLTARGGESMTMTRALRHIVTKLTDEGLVIEVFDLPDAPLFDGPTAIPVATLQSIAQLLAEVLEITDNQLAVSGHVHSFPITLINNPVWALSGARAQVMRDLLQDYGIEGVRFQRITGFADRKPVTPNPMAVRNNRLEIILLRRNT
jgi:chemotaxis protein MotB